MAVSDFQIKTHGEQCNSQALLFGHELVEIFRGRFDGSKFASDVGVWVRGDLLRCRLQIPTVTLGEKRAYPALPVAVELVNDLRGFF